MTYIFLHLIMHYYAFVIVSLTWFTYFLSHDYLSYINLIGFLYTSFFNISLDILSVLAERILTDLFIFRFLCQLCLRSKLRLLEWRKSVKKFKCILTSYKTFANFAGFRKQFLWRWAVHRNVADSYNLFRNAFPIWSVWMHGNCQNLIYIQQKLDSCATCVL